MHRLEVPAIATINGPAVGMCHNTDDHIEALTAVVERRAPQFKGR